MKEKLITGVLPAVFSVYDKEMNVLTGTVAKMVNYQLKNGVSGFYVCGATGECVVLPKKTRIQMLEAVTEANAGRGKIIAHIGAGHLDETLELLKHANTLNIDAVASLPPSLQAYYRKDEVLEYYKILAENSAKPVYAYVTNALNCDVVDFAKSLTKIENIGGLKITIPDYYKMERVIHTASADGVNVLNGPDETLACGLICGADGGIGTSYNILPKTVAGIYESVKNGRAAEAEALQKKLNDLIEVGLKGNIARWKAFMTVIGFDMGYTVAPAKQVTKEDISILEKELREIGFFDMIAV